MFHVVRSHDGAVLLLAAPLRGRTHTEHSSTSCPGSRPREHGASGCTKEALESPRVHQRIRWHLDVFPSIGGSIACVHRTDRRQDQDHVLASP